MTVLYTIYVCVCVYICMYMYVYKCVCVVDDRYDSNHLCHVARYLQIFAPVLYCCILVLFNSAVCIR